MKRQESLLIFFAVALFLLIALVSSFLYLEVHSLKAELQELSAKEDADFMQVKEESERAIESLGNEVRAIRVELQAVNSSLSSSIRNITEEFGIFRADYEALEEQYIRKSEEFENLSAELDLFVYDLEQKMYWYSENKDFSGLEKKPVLNLVNRYCIDGRDLNVPCMIYFIEKQNNFAYRTENKDYIKSLDEFMNEGGGDCEDWTVFISAYLREYSDKFDTLILAERSGPDDRFIVYREEEADYYFQGYNYYNVKMDGMGAYPVCFIYPGSLNGHCLIALGKEKLENPDEIAGAYLFESQTGEYLGRVTEGERPLLQLKEGEIPLEIIINSEDIFVYSSGEWLSYSRFLERAENLLAIKQG